MLEVKKSIGLSEEETSIVLSALKFYQERNAAITEEEDNITLSLIDNFEILAQDFQE